jgi:hypothetical protein
MPIIVRRVGIASAVTAIALSVLSGTTAAMASATISPASGSAITIQNVGSVEPGGHGWLDGPDGHGWLD